MDKVKNFFSEIWIFLKKFHWYGWAMIGVIIGCQTLCFYLSRTINDATGMNEHALIPKIDAIDNAFPLIPFFIIIYIYAFPFWGFAILATARTNKTNFINMSIASLISCLVGFIMLISFPTYIDRTKEGIESVYNRPGFINWLITFIYNSDGGKERSVSLFPSFHCLVTLTVALGTFHRKDSPIWWRIIALVSVILICLSTLLTKQHYFVDVIFGLAISAIVYIIIQAIDPGNLILDRKNK